MRRTLHLALLLCLVACKKPEQAATPAVSASTDTSAAAAAVAHGRELVTQYNCIACHKIAGFETGGSLGPSLEKWGTQQLIVEKFPNTPANLAQWIMNPQALDPASTMPPSGMVDADARDTAAFLLSLK